MTPMKLFCRFFARNLGRSLGYGTGVVIFIWVAKHLGWIPLHLIDKTTQ